MYESYWIHNQTNDKNPLPWNVFPVCSWNISVQGKYGEEQEEKLEQPGVSYDPEPQRKQGGNN